MMRRMKILLWAALLILLFGAVSLAVAQIPEATAEPTTTAEVTSAATAAATEPATSAESTTAVAAAATAEATAAATAEVTTEATETPSPAITLVPFTDQSYGISGVMPDGWKSVSPGVRARSSSASDVALIAQQSAAGSMAVILNALLPQLALKTPPAATGIYKTAFAEWTLYEVDVPVRSSTISVDLALAQIGNTTYVVLVQGAEHEYDFLHTELFIPALDALTKNVSGPAPTAYRSEDVTFKNGDVTLAGTLTVPKTSSGPFAAVVLVTGSGPQNRDEVLGGIEIAPFALIADALTRAGIAVLRYDDRGVADSTGDFASATTQDFASDAKAAIAYLATRPEIDATQIGMLGHSEGGLVGAMLGAQDSSVAFVILMAGPAVDGKTLLDVQNQRLLEVEGATPSQVTDQIAFLHKLYPLIDKGDLDGINTLIYQQVLEQTKMLTAEQLKAIGKVEDYAHQVADQQSETFQSGWFKSFLNYDPGPDLAKTHVPVLALYGGKDVQVDAGQNAPAMTARLIEGGNRDFSVVVLPDANHLFQKANTGSTTEYGTLAPEFTPDFLPTIVAWLSLHAALKP
jgi:pimeloyl-ACP methyl ester carboxylesterase